MVPIFDRCNKFSWDSRIMFLGISIIGIFSLRCQGPLEFYLQLPKFGPAIIGWANGTQVLYGLNRRWAQLPIELDQAASLAGWSEWEESWSVRSEILRQKMELARPYHLSSQKCLQGPLRTSRRLDQKFGHNINHDFGQIFCDLIYLLIYFLIYLYY